MTGSTTIDYSIGDMFDEVSKKRTAFSTSMRPGVQADEPFLASLQFVDHAANRAVVGNVLCDDEASYETSHRGLRDQRDGPSSPSANGTKQPLIDVQARRKFFEDLSISQSSTQEVVSSKEKSEIVMVVTNEDSRMDAVPLVIVSQEEAVEEDDETIEEEDVDEDDFDEESLDEEVPYEEALAKDVIDEVLLDEEAPSDAEVMASRIIRDNDGEPREVAVCTPDSMASRIIREREIDKAFSLDVTSAFGVYAAPPTLQQEEEPLQEEAHLVLELDESPRLVGVRVFETSSPKAPTYSAPVVTNEGTQDEPLHPSRCEAFAWVKDEASLLLVEFAGWVGVSCGANTDIQTEIRKDFGLVSAFEPARNEASLRLKQMGGLLSEKEAAAVKAENKASAEFTVATEAEELAHEAFEVVESLSAGVSAVLEPAAEEAILMVSEMSESLTVN